MVMGPSKTDVHLGANPAVRITDSRGWSATSFRTVPTTYARKALTCDDEGVAGSRGRASAGPGRVFVVVKATIAAAGPELGGAARGRVVRP